MKRGITPIFSIILLVLFTVSLSTSVFVYVKNTQPTERDIEVIRDITTTQTSYNPIILSESYTNNMLKVYLKNDGNRRMKLNESLILLEIYKLTGEMVCSSDYLSPGGAFEANISEEYLSARGTASFYVKIDPFLCTIRSAATYRYTFHFSAATTSTGEFDTESVFFSICGDGIIEGGEVCDELNNNLDCIPYPGCNADCSLWQVCGNGVVECGEECDDSNTNNGDGCSATCTTEVFSTVYCDDCDNCTTKIQAANSGDIVSLIVNTPADRDETCINFSGAENITFDCQGHIIDGDDDNFGIGIALEGGDNNTIKNCRIQQFRNGFHTGQFAFYNSIYDMVIYNNSMSGMYIFGYSMYNIFKNISIKHNFHGIDLYSADYNTFENITANNNSDSGFTMNAIGTTITNLTAKYNGEEGLELYSQCSDNRISGVYAAYNTWEGISIHGENNTISNFTSVGNNRGIYFQIGSPRNATNNTISNGIIKNNTLVGIGFDCTDLCKDNKIYNCLLNNSLNVDFTSLIYSNFWNTTNQTGTRIFGSGTNIAGNTWINGSSDGYYYDCVDADSDGFCDQSYDIINDTSPCDSNNCDYLPLSDEG